MSRVPQPSSLSLENLLNNVARATDLDDPRSRAVLIEAYQRYTEYLDEVKDIPVRWDTSVTIKVGGKTLRFPNMEVMADFLAELT